MKTPLMASKRGHSPDDSQNAISKYGPTAGVVALGVAVTATYGYAYKSINELNAAQKELTDKLLKIIEEGSQRNVIIDKLTRMTENSKEAANTIANLKITIEVQKTRLDAIEAVLGLIGFNMDHMSHSAQNGQYRNPSDPGYSRGPDPSAHYPRQPYYPQNDPLPAAHAQRGGQSPNQHVGLSQGQNPPPTSLGDILNGL